MHLSAARFRRACPGGSDNLRATRGSYGTPSWRICGSPSGLSRREQRLRWHGRSLQVVLPPAQARRRPKFLPNRGSQPVVIPLGQAQRKSERIERKSEQVVHNNVGGRTAPGVARRRPSGGTVFVDIRCNIGGFLVYRLMVGTFDKANRKALRHGVQELLHALPAEAKDGHLPFHLIETIRMLIVLKMRHEEDPVQLLVTKGDPFRPFDVSFVRRSERVLTRVAGRHPPVRVVVLAAGSAFVEHPILLVGRHLGHRKHATVCREFVLPGPQTVL